VNAGVGFGDFAELVVTLVVGGDAGDSTLSGQVEALAAKTLPIIAPK